MTKLAAARLLALVPLFAAVLGTLGVTGTQTACSSVCSDSEEKACTDTYTTCITAAAAAASLDACQKCVDDYCNCFDSCGSSCNRDNLKCATP